MSADEAGKWQRALYWLLLMALAYGALVIGGEIREAWMNVGESIDQVVPE